MSQELSHPLVIIGFGNQARAWALNLRDSGMICKIALRPHSSSRPLAQEMGFTVIDLMSSELAAFETFALLTPDHTHLSLLQEIQKVIPAQARILYAHGYSLAYDHLAQKFPQWSHLLLAPKAIASELRFLYETKGKLGGVYSVEWSRQPKQDQIFLLTLARALGLSAGPWEVSVLEETQADLFSEQALLCSLLPYGANECFRLLRQKGVGAELAYMECWYEVKLIVDTLIKIGPEKFFDLISPNALIGSQKGKDRLLSEEFARNLRGLLEDIQSGKFEQELRVAPLEELRQSVRNYWHSQELQKTHDSLRESLF